MPPVQPPRGGRLYLHTLRPPDVNKSQLIDKLSALTQQTNKVSEGAVNLFFGNIKEALSAGDKVEIRGFGSFLLKSYGAYTGRNPKTGEKVYVPEKLLPFFRGGKDLRKKVDETFQVQIGNSDGGQPK
jgi:integration host factor subunit beta